MAEPRLGPCVHILWEAKKVAAEKQAQTMSIVVHVLIRHLSDLIKATDEKTC